jgi:diguanylate cyclase (GGDEF)-like protein/PAS domain S-box-containing protein
MDPPRREPSSQQVLLVVLGVFVVAAGIGTTVVLIDSHPFNQRNVLYPIAFGLLMVWFHARPARNLGVGDALETITLDEVLYVPMLLMLEPWQGMGIITLSHAIGALVHRRDLVKTIFNISQSLISFGIGYAILDLFGIQTTLHPRIGVAVVAMAAAITMNVASSVLVRTIVSYTTGMALKGMLAELAGRVLPWTGAVTLGAVGAIAIGSSPPAAVLVLGTVAFVHRAYAATFSELAARRHAERLQTSIGGLRNRADPDEVRADLLSLAKDLLGGREVQIVPAGASSDHRTIDAELNSREYLRVNLGSKEPTERDRETLATLAGVAGDVLRSTEAIAQLRTITDSQSEGVVALDMTLKVTFANPAAAQLLGLTSPTEVIGHRVGEVLLLRSGRRMVDLDAIVIGQHVVHDADATLQAHAGEPVDVAYSVTPLRAEAVQVGAVLVIRDVTERRAFQEELARRALHDELTGLPNRRLLLERLDDIAARGEDVSTQHGLLFLDLDRFKVVNDSYGHLVGDKLLVLIAGRLEGTLSPKDAVARLSGDEFIVLVEEVASITHLTDIAERILEVLERPYDIDGHHIFMTASIGVGLMDAGQGRDDALAAVDAAAYAAKAAGRNCFFVSTDEAVERTRSRLDLEVSLREGLDREELELYFQPIVTTDRSEIRGIEALVRWTSPDRGMMSPADFVPLAEETGLVVPMDRWVLEEACRIVYQWGLREPDRRPLTVSVNLSALQLAQHRLAEYVADTLARTGLPAQQLCVEITETALMHDTDATIVTLDSLHQLGVRVAIDDFGTGYSSLAYLKSFPIEVLKLDQSFTDGLGKDPVDTEIARAVIKMSAALGINLVAEGVETELQRRILQQMGCPLIQGYLVSRPLPAEAFYEFWTQPRVEVEARAGA